MGNKSRRDFSFSKWNLYQRFYPRLFKPKLLANEYVLIPETATYLQYKTWFGIDDRIAYVVLTNKRLIIDSLVLSENSPIKVSIWHSDADSAPRKKGLGQILDNFNSLNCSDYKVFQREDEAGRFLRIIIRPGRFELYLYHPNSRKLYEVLKGEVV